MKERGLVVVGLCMREYSDTSREELSFFSVSGRGKDFCSFLVVPSNLFVQIARDYA